MAGGARYRQLVSPVSLETGIVDRSAAAAAESLARSFSDFESTANAVGGGLRQLAGERAGTLAGAAGTPAPRTGFGAMTRFGHAYNNAAEVAYTNKVQTDLASQLDRIETESEADPVAYAEKTKGLIEGTLKAAPAEWQPQIGQMIQARVAAGAFRVAHQADVKAKQETLASFLDGEDAVVGALTKTIHDLPRDQGDAELARVVADRNAQIQALIEHNVVDPVQAARLRDAFTKRVDTELEASRINGQVENIVQAARLNVDDADKMLATLEADKNLTFGEKTDIRDKVRGQLELLRYERSRTYMEDLTSLSRRLAAGEFRGVQGEARRMYRAGAINPSEYEAYVARAENNRQTEVEKDSKAEALQTVLASGLGLDPANTDHQKAAEGYFTDLAKQGNMATGDDRWQALALATVSQLNILPKSAESWARVALLSNDPDAATKAATFMQQVRQAKPNAFAWNNEPKLEALASTLVSNMDANIDPVQAYELARKTTWDMKDSERKQREENYRQLTRKDTNAGHVGAVLNDAYTDRPGWQNKLPVPVAAQAEFEGLVKEYYLLTDNLEQARDLAATKIKGTWGATEVNGQPEFSKYPVEGKGLPPAVVRADVEASVKPLGLDGTKVHLIPGPSTDRTRGMTWALGFQHPDGSLDTVLGLDGRPLGYALPVGQDFNGALEAARQKNLDRAMAEKSYENDLELQKQALGAYQRRDMP